ncbi:Ff.00g065890.m01.CDS01 [Fusarium sp. VM40]|nr:Ff.00g065890.m01.CDS01 [Fusarium sp. VM40]
MVSSKALAFSCAVLSYSVQANPVLNSSLSPRQDGGIASCDNEAQKYTGVYTDGQGTWAAADGVTHPYKFPLIRKCWWDYFVVEAMEELLPWEKSSGDIYCTDTERCVAEKVSSAQHCQERSVGISPNIGASIAGITLGLSVTATNSESRCVTAQDATACQWNDKSCHAVWTQQHVIRQKGYRRHRCDWGNGDETECMGDWDQVTPTDRINYGCGSKCEDSNICGHTDGTPCP